VQWKGLCECINIAQKNEDDFIIVTFDSFVLKKDFKKFILVNSIIKANMHNCDILVADLAEFNHAVPVNENLFWIDSFSHSAFIVLFAGVYEKIRSIPPELDEVNIYNYLSYITSNKMAVYPFISEPENLTNGYENDIKFQEKGDQLAIYQNIAGNFTFKETV
jgi:glycosyl transferase family 25